MELFSKDTLINKLGVLGPEPLEKSFTLQNFTDIVKKKRSGVTKSVLMDQKTIVGVGNIYSDEALHLARINPLREVTSLSDTEIHNLYTSIREVLSSGIDFGGDSMSDYRNVDGARGAFQRKHKVYLRKGKECLTDDCHGTIQKKVIGGRSAHFCSTCQK